MTDAHAPLGPNDWRQVERIPGQRLTSLTISIDAWVLVHARMRALLEGTSVSRLIRAFLAEYAAKGRERLRAELEESGDEGSDQAVP